jgi:hypothetical protein
MSSKKEDKKISKGDKVHQSDLATIAEGVDYTLNAGIKAWLNAYAQISLIYCMPTRMVQDRKNAKQRLDDMVGGFPFTCELFPWPKDGDSGKVMQPIFQVNLKNASELLQFDFGSGLLQVWGTVPSSKPLFLRVIPEDNLSDTVSNYFPENPDWERTSTRDDSLDEKRTYLCDFPDAILKKPRINWKYAGRMFQAVDDYMPVDFPDDEDFESAAEYIDGIKQSLTVAYRGNYLGGFGGCLGSGYNFLVTNPQTSRLLIRITDEFDRSVGVVAYRDADNSLRFIAEDNYLI